eukprot:364342-Chlamydomonas_euryale.AAC.6
MPDLSSAQVPGAGGGRRLPPARRTRDAEALRPQPKPRQPDPPHALHGARHACHERAPRRLSCRVVLRVSGRGEAPRRALWPSGAALRGCARSAGAARGTELLASPPPRRTHLGPQDRRQFARSASTCRLSRGGGAAAEVAGAARRCSAGLCGSCCCGGCSQARGFGQQRTGCHRPAARQLQAPATAAWTDRHGSQESTSEIGTCNPPKLAAWTAPRRWPLTGHAASQRSQGTPPRKREAPA